jgi:uncharacterized protein (UPF0333 family)
MSEVVEYSLVVMVSLLFVAGSVVTYNSFSSFASGIQVRLTSSAVERLASEAIANGTSSATVAVPQSDIRCAGGVLTVSADGVSQGQALGAACNFSVSLTGGAHRLVFRYSSSQLSMGVS